MNIETIKISDDVSIEICHGHWTKIIYEIPEDYEDQSCEFPISIEELRILKKYLNSRTDL